MPISKRPEVSVIIPCGRPDQVQKTIRGLQRQVFDLERIEVLVVSPVDISYPVGASVLEIFTVKTEVLYSPGRMRNLGAAKAKGSWLAFIDDDCVPPPDWLAKLIPLIRNDQRVAAIGCRVVSSKNDFWPRAADYTLFAAYQYFDKKLIALGSAAIIFRRTCFHAVNGFDENLIASEDWDISLKLQEQGWHCLFHPEIEVQHSHGCNSLRAILKKAYSYGKRSGLEVQSRHRRRMSWLALLSLKLSSRWLYWIMILPYAFLVSLQQSYTWVKYDRKVIAYFPICFIGKVFYHWGVFIRLFSNGTVLEND